MSVPSREKIASWQLWATFLAIIIIYAALRLPGLDVPLDRDEGAFGYLGQLIREGGLPYRDGLDHKPPVAFYINALALEFVPSTARGVHTVLLLYNFLTLVCLFSLARIYFSSLAAGLWCAFCFAVFSANPDIQGFTASTEMWALLPISASLLAAVLAIRRRKPVYLLLSGAAGSIACWTKQTMAASILFVALYAVMAPLGESFRGAKSNFLQSARNAAMWTAGAAVVSGGIVFYFYAHGIVRQFVFWCFTYGFSYARQVTLGDSEEDFRAQIFQIARSNFAILVVGIAVAVWYLARGVLRRRPLSETWPAMVLVFLAFSFLGTLPGYAYPHYFAQLAPAVALAGGQGFRLLSERIRSVSRLPAITLCAAAVLSSSILIDREYFLERDPNRISRTYFELNPFPESKPVADYIAARTLASDLVFIEGSEPQILFYANRRSPSAFVMIYPLMTTHPRYKEFQRQMREELEARPPKYIVSVANIPESLGWDESAEPQITTFLNALIARDYVLERSRLVSGTDGEWIEPGDKRASSDDPMISIFRRKP